MTTPVPPSPESVPKPVPTILIVDDDDSIREITQLTLEVVAEWTVIAASGGEEAVRLAREHQPDAVLLDLMMPVMDGRATFLALRDDVVTQHIPVILLTAKLGVGGQQPWDDLAVAGVISKPFNPVLLGGEISEMLGWDSDR